MQTPTGRGAPAAGAALPTGTVTFLFTDIEGSTRLVERLGTAAWTELLEAHQAIIRSALAAATGVEIKTEGDSFFAVFTSAETAVAASVAMQRALYAHDWPADAAVRVRMGLHTGEGVVAPDADYVGLDVHRAARVASAAHGGQVVVSDTTRALVAGALPEGTTLRDLGEHRLKDLSRPERISQLVISGVPDEFPPLRTLDVTPNNLPVMLTDFIGREAVLAEAHHLLEGTRLLTLTGPGGTGKTRLSLQLAADVADRFPDGLYFVALEPISDPALVPSTIAMAVGVQDVGGASLEDRLRDQLRDRTVLLVLDNMEQVTGAAPFLGDLLRGAPGLTCIVTSRAALHVYGEQEYPVPTLGVPDPAHLPPLDALAQVDGVALFMERARTARPDFRLTRGQRHRGGPARGRPGRAAAGDRAGGRPHQGPVARGHPGAAAGPARPARWRRPRPPGAAADPARRDRLELRPPGAGHPAPLRHDRRLRGRLRARGRRGDLRTRAGGGGASLDVLDGLSSLVDQSLLRQDAQHTHPRFVMLETIRSFAWERLEADGQAMEIRRRHAEYFADFAEGAMPHLIASDRAAWLDRVQDDHDNLRAAIAFAVESGDAHLGMRLVYALWRFWQSRAHLQEGAERTAAVLAIPTEELHSELRARAFEAGGGIAYWRGRLEQGRTYYDAALDISRELGDRHLIADALYNGAMVRNVLEVNPAATVEESLAMLDEAIRLYRATGDDIGAARALWGLGAAQYFSSDWRVAADTFRAAEEGLRGSDDEFMRGWVLHMLGSTEIRLGQLDPALEHITGAMLSMRAAGETTGMVLILDDFADLAAASGDLARSLRLVGAGRALEDATDTRLAAATELVMRRERYREAMGLEDADRLMAEGRAMSLDEAVEYALQAVPQAPAA